MNKLKKNAPCGHFSLIQFAYPLFIIVIISTCYCQVEQKFGFMLYHSNKWNNSFVQSHNSDINNNGIYSIVELNFGTIKIVNSMFATTDSLESLRGGSKKVKNLYGYTNRAFIEMEFDSEKIKHKILFGREYYLLGYGKFSSLIIGKNSRPFDQLMWHIYYKRFIASLDIIQLENIGNNKRYLALHAIEYENNNFTFTLAETILYSGENRSLEWQYINPVLFWTPEMMNNTTGPGNSFLYGGLKLNLVPELVFWVEILIDDWQINRKYKSDLEPNEIGFVGGIQKTGWPYKDSNIWLEYNMITNRTYQTVNIEESYTHRGFPIGHYLGNDFDMFQLYYSQKNMNGQLKPYISLAYLRDGTNSLDTPFDMPWMDDAITMEGGYSELFPTTPITYIFETDIGLEYHFSPDSFINISYFYQNKNKSKTNSNMSQIDIRLLYYLGKNFIY